MITVQLLETEWKAAGQIGLKREALRRARGKSQGEYQDNGGTKDERNAIGAIAEYALAKHLGPKTLRDWCENKSFSMEHQKIPCDVGSNLHVRATSNPRARLLILHPYDPPAGVFIFATVDEESRIVNFHGWILASEGQQPEYWNDYMRGFDRPGRAAYTVDRSLLKPIETIPSESING